ncbi:MAG: hypothetical protein H6Q54_1545 [Deltaproteobacteria bacterium]|nr:hypothetical protein [Deltaproteobacteria bacterium]
MEIGREILWNAGHVGQWITYVFMVITFVLLILGIKKRYAMWKIGKPEPINFAKTAGARIGYFIKSGIFPNPSPVGCISLFSGGFYSLPLVLPL